MQYWQRTEESSRLWCRHHRCVMWRLTCRKPGVWCGKRQQSLWLQCEWDLMLFETTKNVHLQVVYIFNVASCCTKKISD